MGRVYLNKKDIEVLNKIRNMNLVDDKNYARSKKEKEGAKNGKNK